MNNKHIILFVAFCLLKSVATIATANESISTFETFTGNPSELSAQSIPILAGYDLLSMSRGHHHKIAGNTWREIKALSPNTKIFLYQLGPWIADNRDAYPVSALNNLGRYNNDRGSVEGSVNQDHPEWFLLNNSGQRIKNPRIPNWLALDFGNKDFAAYWAKHTLEDVVFPTWGADGILIDEIAFCKYQIFEREPKRVPAKYSNCQSWNKDLSNFIVQVSAELQKNGQQVMVNVGNSHATGSGTPEAWQELSQRSSAPDMMLEEGAFAVDWGKGDVMYWPVKSWQQQINLPSSVSRQVVMISTTDLAPGQRGVSSDGEQVSHSKIIRFATGSYLLARNANGPTTYFRFADDQDNPTSPDRLKSAKRYDEFDIGVPIAKYDKKLPDQDLFFRKYTKGYVYVNPGKTAITSIKAESGMKFSSNLSNARQEGSDWFFDLPPHDAAIIKAGNTSADLEKQTAPPVPPVLQTN